jgi:hypothetical protein
MKFRPVLAAGAGMAAAVAFTAAASPALAAEPNSESSSLDVVGNQVAGLVGVFDNQGALQLAGGQILLGQGNLDVGPQVLARGDIADVTQRNRAAGDAANQGQATQSRAQADDPDSVGLISIVGNQVGGLVEVANNEVVGQAAVGQLGVLQGNANAPIRVLSPGTNGDVTQTNGAQGSGSNEGAAQQSIAHGGPAADQSLIGIVGNQLAGVVGINDNQLVGQLAGGQVGLIQLNANTPIRVLSPGDSGDVTQHNGAQGDASNAGTADQSISTGEGGLLGLVGQQLAPVGVNDSQVAFQGAAGQAGVLQVNIDLPINVLSAGTEGTLDQSNAGGSSAENSGDATSSVGP